MRLIVPIVCVVLLSCSTALGGWQHGVVVAPPATVVHSYHPVGPVVAYPAPVVVARPVVTVRPRGVYRVPLVVAPRVVYRAPVVVAPVPVYAAPVVVRPKVYIPGQPVRNAIRAVTP